MHFPNDLLKGAQMVTVSPELESRTGVQRVEDTSEIQPAHK